MIAHPTLPPDMPGGKPLLRGTPVYTVYIKVGSQQPEWILRYCVPVVPAKAVSGGNVIQLGNPAPVKAPYPRITVVPPVEATRDKLTILHGFLTEKGQFRSLQAVRAEDEVLLARLEPLLSQWEFRPAMRDGVPIEIEVLLVLPHLLI